MPLVMKPIRQQGYLDTVGHIFISLQDLHHLACHCIIDENAPIITARSHQIIMQPHKYGLFDVGLHICMTYRTKEQQLTDENGWIARCVNTLSSRHCQSRVARLLCNRWCNRAVQLKACSSRPPPCGQAEYLQAVWLSKYCAMQANTYSRTGLIHHKSDVTCVMSKEDHKSLSLVSKSFDERQKMSLQQVPVSA